MVYTSNFRGARTDSNVSMTLFGEKRDTGERKLRTPSSLRPLILERSTQCESVMTTGASDQPDRDGDGVGDALVGGAFAEYNITVYTSDMRGAGTDANVFIEMYGTKGAVGETRLDDKANNFERNMRDVFKIKSSDVGDVEKVEEVVIRHDNAGLSPGWLLQQIEVYIGNTGKQIEVHNGNTGKVYFFSCNAWLKKEGADLSALRKELFVSDPNDSGKWFRIPLNPKSYLSALRKELFLSDTSDSVVTSDIRGAGTDADVSLVIYGERGDTGERKLDSAGHNDFERNQTDTFFVTSPNVGMMQKIKVRSSNSGLGAAWHLARVEITSSATGETLPFPYNNWFDKEHGLEHVIWPDRDGDGIGDVGAMGDMVKYRVYVYTSDIRGAGTDANVSIEIHGDKAFIGNTQIENRSNNFEQNNFEQNMKDEFEVAGYGDRNIKKNMIGDILDSKNIKDEFEVTGSDVGEIQRIVIGHDNSGLGGAWHLAQVEIFHPVLQKTYVFACNEWPASTDNVKGLDGCKRELLTGSAAAAAGLVSYKVLVKTSDVRGAGTDADVFITVYGPKGDTGERELDSSNNDFERNKLDTFVLTGPDIGEPDHIKIRSTNSGLGAAWHLDKEDVMSSARNNSSSFPFNNWIDQKPSYLAHLFPYHASALFLPMSCCLLLRHGTWRSNSGLEHITWRDGIEGQSVPQVDYRVNVYTSDMRYKNIEYRVNVSTSDIRGAGTDANVFVELHGMLGVVGQQSLERGNLDTFVVKGTDIGDVEKVIVWHDNAMMGSAWHLQSIDVFNPATQRTYYFPCDAWLEETKAEGIDGCKKVLLEGGAGAAAKSKYKVEVKTSDVRGAGTDADISIQVFGKTGDTGSKVLDDSKDNFERNMLDTFFVEGPDIGDIQSCRIVCDGSGLGAGWHLDYIIVTNMSTGATAKFLYKDWVDDKKGWSHTLFPEGVTPNLARVMDYQVTVYTSDIRGAGTDGDVFITLA
eukprot:gene18432-24908_t